MDRRSVIKLDESTSMGLPARDDVVVAKAKGATLWDVSGRKYTDLFSGISVANVGHVHDHVSRAIEAQLKRYLHVSGVYYNDVSPRLAEMLIRSAPVGLSRTFFANSGAEAVEGAVKVAKRHSVAKGRNGMVVLAYQGSFHGRLGLSLTLTGQHKYKKRLANFASYPGVVHVPPPYHYRYGDGQSTADFGQASAERLAELVDEYLPGDVTALIAEPVMGEGGIIVPPDNYFPLVQRLLKERGIAFIADEVQTGIARTGKMFACEHWGLKPDIMTLAKGLGGGLPLAAILATEEVASSLEPGDHFSTFGGNPVCCAAGIAVLEVVRRERLVQRSSSMGAYAMKLLSEVASKGRLIGEVRGKGLMIGVELVKDRKKTPAVSEAAAVKKEMLRMGFLLGVGGIHRNVLRFQPPLVISEELIASGVTALGKALSSA